MKKFAVAGVGPKTKKKDKNQRRRVKAKTDHYRSPLILESKAGREKRPNRILKKLEPAPSRKAQPVSKP